MATRAAAWFQRMGRLNRHLSENFLGGPRVLKMAWVWGGVFLTNIMLKEASMSRHPEWQSYRKRTGLLLPRILPPRG